MVESFKLAEPPKETKVLKTHEFPKVAKSYVLVKTTHGPEMKLGHRDNGGCRCPRWASSLSSHTSQPLSPAGKHATRRPATSALSPTPLPPLLIPVIHSFFHLLAHHLFPATSTWSDTSRCPTICDGWTEGWTYLEGSCSKLGCPARVHKALPIPSTSICLSLHKSFH